MIEQPWGDERIKMNGVSLGCVTKENADEIVQLAKDAARYRWLRAQNELLEDGTFYVGEDAGADNDNAIEWVGSDLDAAIDAAMLKTPNVGGKRSDD